MAIAADVRGLWGSYIIIVIYKTMELTLTLTRAKNRSKFSLMILLG